MDKWLLKIKKERKKMNYLNEKEIPDYINCYYYYINNDNKIEKIKKEKKKIKEKNKITSEEIIYTICEKQRKEYILDEILLFNIDKLIPIPFTIDEILLEPSIFIYHDINCIFFIFKKRNFSREKLKTLRIKDKSNSIIKYTRKNYK